MVEGLEYMVHAGAVVLGLTCGLIGNAHRGKYVFDNDKETHVSVGNGLNTKIIDKVPEYRHVSPAIDHVAAGIGIPAMLGGVGGLILHGIEDLALNDSSRYPFMISYVSGAMVYGIFELAYEATSFAGTKRKVKSSDALQWVADIASPIGLVYLANSVSQAFL